MEIGNPEPKFGQRPNINCQPRFIDQAGDTTRQGLIVSAARMEYGLGSDTSISGNVPDVRTYTEHQALVETMLLLEDAMTHPEISEEVAARARDIYENLSFYGEKELAAATYAIAEYWKAYLEHDPRAVLFIVTRTTFEDENLESEDANSPTSELGYISENKSDCYIVDHVLSNFSDEQLQKYGDRLIFSATEIIERELLPTKTIVLDDWIMSGQQMQDTLSKLFEQMAPEDVEINVIASSRERLANGFTCDQVADPIPVKACFTSHPATHQYASEFGGSYLTAAHSTGDYPFEGTIEEIVQALNEVATSEVVYMPPLTNIIRPYYSPDYLPRHTERYRAVRAMARTALAGQQIAPQRSLR